MKTNIINLVILSILILQILACKNKTNCQHNTFLVKTQLSKQELETLLHQGETQSVKLMENSATTENQEKTENELTEFTVEEVKNNTLDEDDTLEEQIEKEIQEDALHPLDEFHVAEAKNPEVKTLITKPEPKIFDSLYEKRFGKFAGYLILFLFVFVLIYYRDIIFKQKRSQETINYRNLFDYDTSKEYMLVKNK